MLSLKIQRSAMVAVLVLAGATREQMDQSRVEIFLSL